SSQTETVSSNTGDQNLYFVVGENEYDKIPLFNEDSKEDRNTSDPIHFIPDNTKVKRLDKGSPYVHISYIKNPNNDRAKPIEGYVHEDHLVGQENIEKLLMKRENDLSPSNDSSNSPDAGIDPGNKTNDKQ